MAVSSSSPNQARSGFQMGISNRAKPQGQSYSSASNEVVAPQQRTTMARVAKPSSR